MQHHRSGHAILQTIYSRDAAQIGNNLPYFVQDDNERITIRHVLPTHHLPTHMGSQTTIRKPYTDGVKCHFAGFRIYHCQPYLML